MKKPLKNIGFLLYSSEVFTFVWQRPIFALTLFSAFNGLTSVFEMGTGVTHWLSSPYFSLNQRIVSRCLLNEEMFSACLHGSFKNKHQLRHNCGYSFYVSFLLEEVDQSSV